MSQNISYNVHLHEAVTQGDSEWTEAALSMGGDPNCINEKGNTPLHIFVLFAGEGRDGEDQGQGENPENKNDERAINEKAVLTLLMEHGAKLDRKNTAGQTPIELAQSLNKWKTALMLATYTIENRGK